MSTPEAAAACSQRSQRSASRSYLPVRTARSSPRPRTAFVSLAARYWPRSSPAPTCPGGAGTSTFEKLEVEQGLALTDLLHKNASLLLSGWPWPSSWPTRSGNASGGGPRTSWNDGYRRSWPGVLWRGASLSLGHQAAAGRDGHRGPGRPGTHDPSAV